MNTNILSQARMLAYQHNEFVLQTKRELNEFLEITTNIYRKQGCLRTNTTNLFCWQKANSTEWSVKELFIKNLSL